MNHLYKIHQFDNSHFGKFNLAQHVVMMVVGDNVTCVGLYGTINKLVVVRVCSDKIEMIIGRKEYNVLTLYNRIEDKVGSSFPASLLSISAYSSNISLDTQSVFLPVSTDSHTSW